MLLPGMAVVELSVLTIDRSPVGTRVVLSVEELLLGSGSVQPVGAVTVAVLETVPLAEASMRPVTVKVAVPPASRFTSTLEMLPVPLAELPLEPLLYTTDQAAFKMDAGRVSFTAAATTLLGPELLTVMV